MGPSSSHCTSRAARCKRHHAMHVNTLNSGGETNAKRHAVEGGCMTDASSRAVPRPAPLAGNCVRYCGPCRAPGALLPAVPGAWPLLLPEQLHYDQLRRLYLSDGLSPADSSSNLAVTAGMPYSRVGSSTRMSQPSLHKLCMVCQSCE